MPSNSWINGAKVSWSWVTESIHYYQCILYVYATAAAMIIFFFYAAKMRNSLLDTESWISQYLPIIFELRTKYRELSMKS